MYFCYILYAEQHDRYYIGQTNDLDKRLARHNHGYVKSTKPYLPWKLVYAENYESRIESMKRENYLKSMKSKDFIRNLVKASG